MRDDFYKEAGGNVRKRREYLNEKAREQFFTEISIQRQVVMFYSLHSKIQFRMYC